MRPFVATHNTIPYTVIYGPYTSPNPKLVDHATYTALVLGYTTPRKAGIS